MFVAIRPNQSDDPEPSARRFQHHESTADAVLSRKQRAIRSHKNHVTTWYRSEGTVPITALSLVGTRLSHPVQVGDLLVHLYSGEAADVPRAQIFVCEEDISISEGNRRWREIQPGHQHPLLSTHNLTLTRSGDPSWVRRQTITTYAGRSKQKRRVDLDPVAA